MHGEYNAFKSAPECRTGDCRGVEVALTTGFFAAYGVAFVLVVGYFLNEDSPCHSTQKREHAFLSTVLALIVAASTLTWWDPAKMRVILQYEQVQHFLLMMFAIQISQRLTAPQKLPGFFELRVDAAGPFFEGCRPQLTTRGIRIVERLKDLEARVLAMDAGFWGKASFESFSGAMLAMFMALQMMAQRRKIIYEIHNWLPVAWLVVLALLALDEFKRRCQVEPLRQQIFDLVREACESPDENVLRHVLWSVSVATLLEVGGAPVLDLLCTCSVHLSEWRVTEKAILIDALMKRGLQRRRPLQVTVRDLILGCKGKDVTILKNLIDGGADYNNLYKLVYIDVTSRELRRSVKCHLTEQGMGLRLAAKGGRTRPVGIKVLSDVDDTLYSSGGKFPAGCDKSFPKHMIYPGCLALFRALDAGWTPQEPSCSLVFLSARPHFYKSVFEDHSYRLFRVLVHERRMHSMPTLLPGEKWRGIWAVLTYPCRKTGAWRRVGRLKHRTFRNYAQLYPEYDFVFVGDNGQGDLLAGQMMLLDREEFEASADGTQTEESEEETLDEDDLPSSVQRAAAGHEASEPNVLAVLIHHVMPDDASLALERPDRRDAAWREQLRRKNLFFFDTYVGAAAVLHESLGDLITADQLRSVAESALLNFEADVRHHAQDKVAFDWSEVEEKLRGDLARAGHLLAHAGRQPLEELPTAATLAPRSDSRRSLCSASSAGPCGDDGDVENADGHQSSEDDEESSLLE